MVAQGYNLSSSSMNKSIYIRAIVPQRRLFFSSARPLLKRMEKPRTNEKGEFVRQSSLFRNHISREPGAKYPPEAGRYHLYVSWACPWAHRTLITRKLKGLEDIISFSVVDWYLGPEGWKFNEEFSDPNNEGTERLMDLYKHCDPDYQLRATVPTLWDKKTKSIVSNESADIIRFLYTEFDDLVPKDKQGVTFYPDDLAKQIDEFNDFAYGTINNGVYKAGFATKQEAYEENVKALFAALDKVEEKLGQSKGDYVLGDRLTEADIRLYPTIVRFDPVYVEHFKCNIRTIRGGYPNIHKWLRNLYWNHPAFGETTEFDHIKWHYTKSHKQINPNSITPVGPLPHIMKL